MRPDAINADGFRLFPPGTRKGNRYWIARGKLDGKQVELNTRAADLDAALAAVPKLKSLRGTPQYAGLSSLSNGKWQRRLLCQAADRARAKGLQFTLTLADVKEMARRANGRCEVSGLPFCDDLPGDCRRRPYAPSIDRRQPDKGYIPDNCRLVCFAVNVAMSDWGEGVLRAIADAMAFRRG